MPQICDTAKNKTKNRRKNNRGPQSQKPIQEDKWAKQTTNMQHANRYKLHFEADIKTFYFLNYL